MNHLTEDEIKAAREWAATQEGCTCPTTFDGDRYVVDRHTCPVCLAWDCKLTDTGVSHQPKAVVERKTARRKWRKAA